MLAHATQREVCTEPTSLITCRPEEYSPQNIHQIVLIHLSPVLCPSALREEIELFKIEIP